MIEVTIQAKLAEVNQALNEYVAAARKSPDEVLEKKGRDLAIKVFQGFWAQRLKATKAQRKAQAGFRGPAFDEAKARGWRVKIRSGLKLNANYRLARAKTKGGRTKRNGLSDYALLVAQELSMRQRGAGLLGVSFLHRRWRRGTRTSTGRTGRYLSHNVSKKLGLLSAVEKGQNGDSHFLRITNKTPGVAIVDANKQIIAIALERVRADTRVYLERKAKEAGDRALKTLS